MADRDLDRRIYVVVLNHEEQYSIWFADKPLPPGWTAVGFEGTKDECLRHIEQVWTDMRPLSVRRHMERIAGRIAT
jgi:MbtH protein